MSEANVVKNSSKCHTTKSLVEDLKKLGIHQGDVLLVHSSLSSIGWVAGREIAVIQALLAAVGEEGTIVMPSFTGDNSNPDLWQNPPVPESWRQTIKEELTPFDPRITPTREMGRIAEAFWHYPGVLRSSHPQVSFSAYGKYAKDLTSHHELSPGFGKQSPLYRLYDMHAKTLLLGVSYGNCTCMHLAETMLDAPMYMQGSRMIENGEVIYKEFLEIEYNDEPFLDIGLAYEKEHEVTIGKIGDATSRLIDIVDIVTYTKTKLHF